jgi:hypothetical protein
VEHGASIGEERGMFMVLVGSPEGKRPLGRPRHRWEDNIKMDLRDSWGKLDLPGSGQGPVAGFCEHGNEPAGSIRRWDIF